MKKEKDKGKLCFVVLLMTLWSPGVDAFFGAHRPTKAPDAFQHHLRQPRIIPIPPRPAISVTVPEISIPAERVSPLKDPLIQPTLEVKVVSTRGRVLQVITDIDDTVKSSGGVRLLGVALGGIDTQYPRGQFYPGAFQFLLELSRFGVPEGRDPARVAVLTARAREFKFALELKPSHKVCVKFAKAGVEGGVDGWGVGRVLYGSVKEWICQQRKGLRKFRNFETLRAEDRFDLTDYIFIGDTGELDLQAGESMIRKYPTRMKALFMHYVSEKRPSPPGPVDRTLLGVPIIYFRTYVGAAMKAAAIELIGKEAVQAVIDTARRELSANPRATKEQWADLEADIKEAERTVLAFKGSKRKDESLPIDRLISLRKFFRPPSTELPRPSVRVRE